MSIVYYDFVGFVYYHVVFVYVIISIHIQFTIFFIILHVYMYMIQKG